MHYNYKLDKQTITNIMKRHFKSIKNKEQVKLIIYYTKFKTSNLIVKNNTNSAKILLNQTNIVFKFICPFQKCLLKIKNNIYMGYASTTLSRHLTYHLSENSTIKQHLIIKYNKSTDQITSSDVRKILTDNTKTFPTEHFKTKHRKRFNRQLQKKTLQIIKTIKTQNLNKNTRPLMMTKSMIESIWAENMGQFLYRLNRNSRKITRLEKLLLKIINSVPSSLVRFV